jgi:hypothetical protein
MNKPNPKPIDPETPRAKSVKSYSLNQLYPESMEDDVYIKPNNHSVYVPIDLDKINKQLDEINYEDHSKDN